MIYLSLLHHYLRIEVDQKPKCIFIGELLSKFGMQDCNFVSTPMKQNLMLTSNEGDTFEDPTKYMQRVESLIYLTTTRPDITFVVGILSTFMHQPCEGQWVATKRVLKYLKGTQPCGTKYSKVSDFQLTRYSDSDFDGDKEHEVSTSGYLINLRSTTITCRSRKKYVPVHSTTEAKYVAAPQATKAIIWLRNILEYLQEKQRTPMLLFIDNISTIQLAKDPKFHDRIKHFNIMQRPKPFSKSQISLPKHWDVKSLKKS